MLGSGSVFDGVVSMSHGEIWRRGINGNPLQTNELVISDLCRQMDVPDHLIR